MSTSTNPRLAEQLYLSSRALVHEGRYHDALIELQRAENAFHSLDARRYLFSRKLSNGVSGLANTLVLSGFCHQKLGNYKAALTCYETSLINSKFENQKALSDFTKTFTKDLIVCYEKTLEDSGDGMGDSLLGRDPEITISFQFPFSLSPDVIPVARLYELAPARYAHFKDLYQRAKEKDSALRRRSKASDDSTMKRTSIYVWGILSIIWAAYGLIVTHALFRDK